MYRCNRCGKEGPVRSLVSCVRCDTDHITSITVVTGNHAPDTTPPPDWQGGGGESGGGGASASYDSCSSSSSDSGSSCSSD